MRRHILCWLGFHDLVRDPPVDNDMWWVYCRREGCNW